MSNQFGLNQYRQTSVLTANQGQVLIMLYEAAIKNIKKAIACIEQKNIAEKGVAIGKAHDIINELSNTLNFEVESDIPGNLESLYNYMIQKLLQANAENSIEKLDDTLKILQNLLSAWEVAVQKVNQSKL